ncbi:MAG: alcohol dehydrogenase catalytic domain-containing protein [Planctomycetaceae bacterium]|jgi:2-desacetyl-2-hydroxyethyl bacteriochlorophyllide A dehydrogenase|nr:alcohol dehydrogenase catalytic domain-containing protein [Planctomycetaceae bacterium]
MKAIVVVAPNRVEVQEIPKPEPGPYEVLAKNKVASLCNATDRKLIEGHFPGIHQYPLVLGHEGVAVVEAVGSKVRNIKIGDQVISGLLNKFGRPDYHSGWGGFCEYVIVHDHDAMVADGVANAENGWFDSCEIQTVVDTDIPLEEAVLLCTWREVYGGIGDFNLKAGNEILIFGAGPVGLSFVKFARLLGMKWIGVVETNLSRHEKILAMGADQVFVPDDVPLLRNKRPPLDAVIDAVGNTAIVSLALPLLKLGGSMCIYGVISEDTINVKKSLAPYNFNLFVHQWPTRFRERAAQKPLCQWIREGKLKAADFVTHRFPIEQINSALEAGKTGQVIKCLLTY